MVTGKLKEYKYPGDNLVYPMKKLLFVISFLFTIYEGDGQILVADNFADRSKFYDNTLLTIWGSNASATTGFVINPKTDINGLTFNGVSLTTDAISHSGYTNSNSLKTLTSLDYALPFIVDRTNETISIEFDAIWDATANSGENGRMVVTLMDMYPSGGALFNQVNDVSLTDPFGKPLYNIRIRNNPGTSLNGPLMLYGAGTTPQPEWEKYGTGPWWLPGFSVQAGGGSPGTGPDYPLSGTYKSTLSIVSTTIWKHYTWRIFPERMELYARNTNQPASSNSLILFMQIPKNISPAYIQGELLAAHGNSTLPPNYDWFRYANAVRFYWRGGNNSHLANVEISRSTATLLPVENITGLKAEVKERFIYLSGIVKQTDKNSETEIQHSIDGRHFKTISNLEDNLIIQDRFEFIHKEPAKGKNFYRIKIDNKINIRYTEVVMGNIVANNQINIYPNPGKGKFHIESSIVSKVFLKIYDINGRIVYSQWQNSGSLFNLNKEKGVYFYTITNGVNTLKTGRLVIQ